jgi:hypothetical protein
MKHILTGLALAACLGQSALAAPVLLCDGTYIASQRWLSSMKTGVFQGGRPLGPVTIRVRECGDAITLTAQGTTIALRRSLAGSATYIGTHQTRGPRLEFTLTAQTPRTIGGTMVASDGQLGLKRTLALMLKKGEAADMTACAHEAAQFDAATPGPDPAALTGLFKAQNLQPAPGFSLSDYIRSTSVTARDITHMSIYMGADGTILPRVSDAALQQAICTGKPGRYAPPAYVINFKLTTVRSSRTDSFAYMQVIDIETGKILEQQEGISEGEGTPAVTAAMNTAWGKTGFGIGQMGDGLAK